MKRFVKLFTLVAVMTVLMCSTAFAEGWKQDQNGWYWEDTGNSYPVSTWRWLDGNQDGIAECYYFDSRGYLATNRTTPDGYQVNQDGCWIVNNVPQTQGTRIDQSSMDIYNQAMQKTNSLDSYHATAAIQMNFAIDGSQLDADMTMDMKIKDLYSSNIKYLMDMKMTMLGQTVDMTAFYADGYYYMESSGSKFRMAMPMNEMMQSSQDMTSSFMQDGSFMQEMQVTDDGNGNQVISFVCSPDDFNGMLNQIVGSMGIDTASVTLRDYRGTMIMNPDGYCTSMKATMKMDMTVEGTTISCDVVLDMNYINPGQPVDFALPSTEGYQEIAS